MDEFERQHVTGEGDVLFRDKIPVPRWLLPLFVIAPILIFAMLAFVASFPMTTAAGIALAMGLFAFLGNIMLMGLRTVVSEGGIDVYTGIRKHHIAFADIAGIEQTEYRLRDYPMGRGLVKWGPRGKAFVGALSVRSAVELTMKTGKRIRITTNDPAGLESAVSSMTGVAPKVRVAVDEQVEQEAHETAAERIAEAD